MKRTLIAIIFSFASSIAYADCPYNGNSYPTGTLIGGLTCQTDGNWR